MHLTFGKVAHSLCFVVNRTDLIYFTTGMPKLPPGMQPNTHTLSISNRTADWSTNCWS